MRVLFATAAIVFFMAASPLSFSQDAGVQPASLLQEVVGPGVEIPGLGKTAVLPPMLAAELTPPERAAALKSVSRGGDWKRFSRKSVVAPLSIDLEYLKNSEGERMGHRVHLAFVVHASLETLKDQDLMKQMFAGESKPEDADTVESEKITVDELSQRGIAPDDKTSFSVIQFPLLDKVTVKGVLQIQQTTKDDTIVLAVKVDPRFSTRNAWAPISEKGDPDWRPYQGAAGYLSVTRLSETDGTGLSNACFIESRFIIYEPTDWFRGSNLLRSKIPLLLQESARKLRRKLQ
ncbi:hypothetical protein [Planctomycetes bacterium K23_9]|uniref:Uncharacterized protein n=1 Tax=Stieleria marina TaxID=1930275 RepID=A0A517NZ57_9BACT|nr:hypothetical protein K239x_44190 [Planctomycetes bacterium K23_9]